MKREQVMENNDVKPKNIERWSYVILGIIMLMLIGTVYSYSVFRVSIEKNFNIGSTESGMPYMTSLAVYALFMLLTGRHINKCKPSLIIFIGGIVFSIGWILSSFSPNIYILTITYGLISGAGAGIVYGVPMTVVARWFPDKKGLAVGMVLIGFGLSPLITAPLARIFVENYGVMNTFLILGICFGIAIPILSYPFKFPSELKSMSIKTNQSNVNDVKTLDMIRSKSFRGLYLNFMIGTMIGLMLIGMTSNIGVEYIGLAPRKVALFLAIFTIFNGIGRPIFGWLTDKITSKKAMLLSYGLIIFSAVLVLLAGEGNVVVFIISFSLFWFNLGGWLAIAPASTLSLYGTKNYSQNYGLVFTAYGIGAITGVVTSGMLIDVHKN